MLIDESEQFGRFVREGIAENQLLKKGQLVLFGVVANQLKEDFFRDFGDLFFEDEYLNDFEQNMLKSLFGNPIKD